MGTTRWLVTVTMTVACTADWLLELDLPDVIVLLGLSVLLVAPFAGGGLSPCTVRSICLSTGWFCLSDSTLVISRRKVLYTVQVAVHVREKTKQKQQQKETPTNKNNNQKKTLQTKQNRQNQTNKVGQ